MSEAITFPAQAKALGTIPVQPEKMLSPAECQAVDDFSAFFIAQLMKDVFKPGLTGGMGEGSIAPQSALSSSLYWQELARVLAEQDAFGLRKVLAGSIHNHEIGKK